MWAAGVDISAAVNTAFRGGEATNALRGPTAKPRGPGEHVAVPNAAQDCTAYLCRCFAPALLGFLLPAAAVLLPACCLVRFWSPVVCRCVSAGLISRTFDLVVIRKTHVRGRLACWKKRLVLKLLKNSEPMVAKTLHPKGLMDQKS